MQCFHYTGNDFCFYIFIAERPPASIRKTITVHDFHIGYVL